MSGPPVLPAAHESPRCADYARSWQVDPGGTAIRADLLVSVEVPLPWPKPVFAHDLLAGVPELVAAAPCQTRVLASVPRGDDASLSIVAFKRDSNAGSVRRTEWICPHEALGKALAEVVAGGEPSSALPVQEPPPSAEVWICTQGSHDMCCGADGTRLAQAVEGRWNDVVVRRVSHTGGHRFAPTAITLPDGRMWGYLDVDGLETALRKQGDHRSISGRCRGWWGAEPGPPQVAEGAVFAATGWAWETAPRFVEVIDETDGISTVRVSAGEGAIASWLVTVGVAREVPTIACRAAGGLPAKPGVEYSLIDLQPEARPTPSRAVD